MTIDRSEWIVAAHDLAARLAAEPPHLREVLHAAWEAGDL